VEVDGRAVPVGQRDSVLMDERARQQTASSGDHACSQAE